MELISEIFRQSADKMPKLNETFVRAALYAETGTTKHWDTEIRGLVLFVGKRTRTWYFQKDIGGKTSRTLIGRHPTISATIARETAMRLTLEMSRGAGQAAQVRAPTLLVALDDYLARPKLRSEAHKVGMRQLFEMYLRDWFHIPLDEITKAKVVAKHRSMARTPSSANHALKYFRSVWNHARRVYTLPECPTSAIEWYDEEPDGRIIADLLKWRSAVEGLENPVHTAFYKLLLYTGLRKTEAFTLEWRNVHDDWVHLPMTKNGRSFDLPIQEVHRSILKPIKGIDDRWVFPSTKGVDGHITNPARVEWSPHAHRRTFATLGMEAGVLEETIGRLLNHTPKSITGQRYVRPSFEALRPAMEATCAEIDRRLLSLQQEDGDPSLVAV